MTLTLNRTTAILCVYSADAAELVRDTQYRLKKNEAEHVCACTGMFSEVFWLVVVSCCKIANKICIPPIPESSHMAILIQRIPKAPTAPTHFWAVTFFGRESHDFDFAIGDRSLRVCSADAAELA